MERERATELEYLQWFYQYSDFGPADGDVRAGMQLDFMDATGKNLPLGYNVDPNDGETIVDRDSE